MIKLCLIGSAVGFVIGLTVITALSRPLPSLSCFGRHHEVQSVLGTECYR